MAVALCVARACELLRNSDTPSIVDFDQLKIEVSLSPNVLKNAMGVGIPGTEMIGLPIAVALGAIVGRSAYKLEVLKDTTPKYVTIGNEMAHSGRIAIGLKEGNVDKLYIETTVSHDNSSATAVIAGSHTNFVFLSKDGETLLDHREATANQSADDEPQLSMRSVYEFATETPIDRLHFILDSARINMAAAEASLNGNYGHRLGRMIGQSATASSLLGDNTFSHILSYTSAACDARMAGAMISVMSNSGSGNQGISATLPVVVYARDNKCTDEQLTRALILSHLTVIYIKQTLGRLSALCGCVVAATGSSCGITYLMGGDYTAITYAVKNMVANLTGMICDGAKPSCSLKVGSGVSTAILSAMLAIEGECVSSIEGIIDDDVDRCIRNLTTIGTRGMNETDRLVLDIMTHKGC